MNTTWMFQCELRQDNMVRTAWIEERGAKLGARVEVPELGGEWIVIAVYKPPMAKSAFKAMEAQKRRGFASIKRTK